MASAHGPGTCHRSLRRGWHASHQVSVGLSQGSATTEAW